MSSIGTLRQAADFEDLYKLIQEVRCILNAAQREAMSSDRRRIAVGYRDALRSQTARLWRFELPKPPIEESDPDRDISDGLLPWVLDCMDAEPRQASVDQERSPDEDDYRVAEKIIKQASTPPDPTTSKYRAIRESLARQRAKIGAALFDLFYGLREPRDKVEVWRRELWRGEINQDELEERLKMDANRPVDAEMIRIFCGEYEARLEAYGDMQQHIIDVALGMTADYRQHEQQIDGIVKRMRSKMPLYREQLEKVYEFLANLRADSSGEPVKCGDYTGESAHFLATTIMGNVAELWEKCRATGERSQNGHVYAYATTASHLFYEAAIKPGGYPVANDLMALMSLEKRKALAAINATQSVTEQPPADTPATGSRIGSGGMIWQKAQSKAVEHVKAHDGKIPSINRLATIVGCSRSTIKKAVEHSPYLKARNAERKAAMGTGREVSADATIEQMAQSTESHPDELASLIEEQQADMMREKRQQQAAKTSRIR